MLLKALIELQTTNIDVIYFTYGSLHGVTSVNLYYEAAFRLESTRQYGLMRDSGHSEKHKKVPNLFD